MKVLLVRFQEPKTQDKSHAGALGNRISLDPCDKELMKEALKMFHL